MGMPSMCLLLVLLLFLAGDAGNPSEVEVTISECLKSNLGVMYLSDLCNNHQLQLLSIVHNVTINKNFFRARMHLFEMKELFPTDDDEDLSNCLVILRNFPDPRSRKIWMERRDRGKRGSELQEYG